MGPHSRKNWWDKYEVALAHIGTLRASYSGKSSDRIYIHIMPDSVKHLTIDAYRSVKAFITYRDVPGGPIAYLKNLSTMSNLIKNLFYVLQTLLGDFCLVRKYDRYYHSSP